MKSTMKLCLCAALILVFGLGVAACKRPPAPPPAPEVEYITHVVSYQGETLAIISKWYTKSANNWREILTHNSSLDPRKLRVGTAVLIPQYMVLNNKKLPKSAVVKTADVAMPPAPPTETTSTELVQPSEEQQAAVDDTTTNEVETQYPDNNASTEQLPTDEPVAPPAEVVDSGTNEAPPVALDSTTQPVPPIDDQFGANFGGPPDSGEFAPPVEESGQQKGVLDELGKLLKNQMQVQPNQPAGQPPATN